MQNNQILKIINLQAGYEKNNRILKGIDLSISENDVVAIVGQNGAGKSTLAKAIMNMIPYTSGKIYFNGKLINGLPTNQIVNKGLNFFMQGGRIFPHLTIEENLNYAGMGLAKKELKKRKEELKYDFDLFKTTNKKRFNLKASYLSGGEQHQLALAMIMMQNPTFLILDEPSAGLSPQNLKKLYKIIDLIRKEKHISIMLIEQNVDVAVKYSDRIYLLKNGIIEREEKSKNITNLEELNQFFFGDV